MRHIMSNIGFMFLWGLGSIATLFSAVIVGVLLFFAVGLALSSFIIDSGTNTTTPVAFFIMTVWFGSVGVAMGLVFGSIQKAILRMHTRDPWRGWIISSAIGGFIGAVATVLVLASQIAGHFFVQVIPSLDTLLWWAFQFILIFFGSLGFCQTFALSQHSRGAWVWIIANLVAGVVLYSLIAFGVISLVATPLLAIIVGFLVAAAPGIVTGFTLVWLMNSNWRD